MFAVVRHYHFNPEDGAEIDRRIREEFVPIVKGAKGFVRYHWLDTGEGDGASISVFKDKAGADESVRLAAEYVKEHLSKFLTQKPEIIEGPIKAHDWALTISALPDGARLGLSSGAPGTNKSGLFDAHRDDGKRFVVRADESWLHS
jgi:hypothetical protein